MQVTGNSPARDTFLPALPWRKLSFVDLLPLNWWEFDSQAHLDELWKTKTKTKHSVLTRLKKKKHEYVAAFLYFIYGRALVGYWSGSGLSFV